MNLNGIPKFFWFALSLCMMGGTSTLCFLAFKATNVKLEYNGKVVELQRSMLQEDLENFNVLSADVEEQANELKKIAKDLEQQKLEMIVEQANEVAMSIVAERSETLPMLPIDTLDRVESIKVDRIIDDVDMVQKRIPSEEIERLRSRSLRSIEKLR